jgi:hypothetical protein
LGLILIDDLVEALPQVDQMLLVRWSAIQRCLLNASFVTLGGLRFVVGTSCPA